MNFTQQTLPMDAAKALPKHRASLDNSLLTKRTGLDHGCDAAVMSKKRRSMDSACPTGRPAAAAQAFCGFPPMGVPWSHFQMGGAMGGMMGGAVGGMMGAAMGGMPSAMGGMPGAMCGMPGAMGGMPMMGAMGAMGSMMPFCFPPPFIPPFMMPAAMAMWQQAVQQAASTTQGGTTAPAMPACTASPAMLSSVPSCMQAPHCTSTNPAAAPNALRVSDKGTNSSKASITRHASGLSTESDPLSCSSIFHAGGKEEADDFDAMLDSFLRNSDDSSPFMALKDTNKALSASFASLHLLGSFSDFSAMCSPLDLKLSKDDSHLDLLSLDAEDLNFDLL